jgi:phage-related protein
MARVRCFYRNFVIDSLTAVDILFYVEGGWMPLDILLVFCRESGTIPLREWLDELRTIEPRAYAKCLELIDALMQLGNRLGPPRAKLLSDGIWELRARSGRVRYRIFYFFVGKGAACLSHGFKKGGSGDTPSPNSEIELAVKRRCLVISDRDQYTANWEV